jgi:hypothetical protein
MKSILYSFSKEEWIGFSFGMITGVTFILLVLWFAS